MNILRLEQGVLILADFLKTDIKVKTGFVKNFFQRPLRNAAQTGLGYLPIC